MVVKSLTLGKLIGARVWDEIHDSKLTNADGSCVRYRVNGRLREWKTRPDQWEIPVKNGMRSHSYINNGNCHKFHLGSECPYCRFKELEHEEVFEFRKQWFNNTDPVTGPWVRVSARGYVHEDDFKAGWRGMKYKVRSINAWVRRLRDEG